MSQSVSDEGSGAMIGLGSNNNLFIKVWSSSSLTVHLTHILSCLVPVGLDQLN